MLTIYVLFVCEYVNACHTRHYEDKADDHPLFAWSLWWNDTRFPFYSITTDT